MVHKLIDLNGDNNNFDGHLPNGAAVVGDDVRHGAGLFVVQRVAADGGRFAIGETLNAAQFVL